MKITIRGNNVTPEKIAEALAACERDHNLKIKGATIYLRLEDSLGRNCSPLDELGQEIAREFTFNKPRPIKMPQPAPQYTPPAPKDPIIARDMMGLCQRAAHRALSSPEMQILITLEKTVMPERQAFVQALNASMKKAGRFSIRDLENMVIQRCNDT